MPQELHKKLKSKCALSGTTVSKWFRGQSEKFLGEKVAKIEEKIPEIEEVKDFGICKWNKTYKCKSPAVSKKGFCLEHTS